MKGKESKSSEILTIREVDEVLEVLSKHNVRAGQFLKIREDNKLAKKVAELLLQERPVPLSKDQEEELKVLDLSKVMDPDSFFDQNDWLRFYNIKIEDFPALPISLEELSSLLDEKCFFEPWKKVRDTHYLFLLPTYAHKDQMSIKTWLALHKTGSNPGFIKYEKAWYEGESFVKKKPSHSWHLMYKGAIPNSFMKSWKRQKSLLGSEYYTPLACEVIALHFLSCVKSGEIITPQNVQGRVADIDKDGDHICMGRFGKEGKLVIDHDWDDAMLASLGIFAARKLTK